MIRTPKPPICRRQPLMPCGCARLSLDVRQQRRKRGIKAARVSSIFT